MAELDVQALTELRDRVTAIESRENRVLEMIKKLIDLDKLSSGQIDRLFTSMTELTAQVASMAQTARLRAEEHENDSELLAKCCDALSIPMPFPGADSDFGLAPKAVREP